MANIKSSEKSARQTVKRNARNVSILAGVKTVQKRFQKALTEGNLDAAKTEYVTVVSALDKAAKRGVIHQNSASRRKSVATRALLKAKA